MSFDVLIRDGWVLDGTGAPAHRADVGVNGDRITAVGRLEGADAATVVEAAGRHVMPGLVDCHAHGDALVFDKEVQFAALRQGVTTVLQKPRCGHGAHLTFIVTATHRRADVDTALAALAASLPDTRPARTASRHRSPHRRRVLR